MATISACALISGSGEAARANPVIPNDPGFATQWADRNTGQPIPGEEPPTGTPFADERSAEAWALTTGSPSIVIGETDTGADYEHPDLEANIWANPRGLGNCLPGKHGYNALAIEFTPESCDPKDKDTSFGGHGTHVAGIMGAVGNNGIGVAGPDWRTTILPVKWLDNANTETPSTSALVKALKWLVRVKQEGENVRVVNDSATFAGSPVGGTPESAELEHEIRVLGENNILFITSAGNSGVSNDENENHRYPCNYDLPNEICVAASNNHDDLPKWASYGPHTVDLAAPGASIYSTLRREGKTEYGYISGSSMAAAQVSGAAALILSAQPSLTAEQLKADIVNNTDKLSSLQGKVISGGRLDVCRALPGCINFGLAPPPAPASPPPPPPPVPVIGALRITPAAFKAARSGPPISPRVAHAGAKVSYTDSQPALTEFTVLAPRSGVQNAAKRCVAPPRRHSHARLGRHCTRYVSFGRFTRADSPGENRFRFSAHLGRSRLAPGHYRLRAVPSIAGQRGAEVRVAFRIVR